MDKRVAAKAQVAPGGARLAIDPTELGAHAEAAAALLRAMSGKARLLVLCNLVHGERSVGELQRIVGLSQSALSQHLALLREDGLVAFRRESQTLFYRVSDPRAARILKLLKDIYCGNLA